MELATVPTTGQETMVLQVEHKWREDLNASMQAEVRVKIFWSGGVVILCAGSTDLRRC
jgi:hypothetical protein